MGNWAAVLAGGSGTRFWPLSTKRRPKQMLNLAGEKPLLESTVARLDGLIRPEQVLVVTGRSLLSETREILPGVPDENILAEPRAASTAPALTWATQVAAEKDPDATVLSLHADWHVGDDSLFRQTANRALDVAVRNDVLVTVGVVPTRPDPGYGYIQPGGPLEGDASGVKRFVEKPDVDRARALIEEGALWNSGMFAWTATRFFAETERHAPEVAPHLEKLRRNEIEAFFDAVTPVAIDISHFERSERVACVPGRYPWDDVGTWAALSRVRSADRSDNVLVGETFARDSKNCVVWSEEGAVIVDGVSGLVVVKANGVTMVTTKDRCDSLKDLLEELPPEIRSMPR